VGRAERGGGRRGDGAGRGERSRARERKGLMANLRERLERDGIKVIAAQGRPPPDPHRSQCSCCCVFARLAASGRGVRGAMIVLPISDRIPEDVAGV